MKIICYRCGGGENPENTMLAIEHCQQIHPEWPIEMDINLTKDGEVILFHDNNTERVTGENQLVKDLNMEDINALNAGYNFQQGDQYTYREHPLRIPQLKDVLERFPSANLILDVHTPQQEIVPLIIDLVERHDMSNQVLIVSEYDHIIDHFKSLRPSWKYGAATKEAKRLIYSSFIGLDAFFPLRSDYLMIPKYFGKIKVLTGRVIRHVLKRNKKICCWMLEGDVVKTVESLEQAKALTDMGVHGVFTDFPERLKKELDSRKAK